MNRPLRGDRESAATTRYVGCFFLPIRMRRSLTAMWFFLSQVFDAIGGRREAPGPAFHGAPPASADANGRWWRRGLHAGEAEAGACHRRPRRGQGELALAALGGGAAAALLLLLLPLGGP